MIAQALARGAAALFLILWVGGCGGDDDSARQQAGQAAQAEKAPPAAAAQKAKPPVISPPAGAPPGQAMASPAKSLRGNIELPDSYPGDAPRYPGSSSSHYGLSKDLRSNALFGTDDSVAEVSDYIFEFMDQNGWEGGSQREVPGGTQLSGTKQNRELIVMVREIAPGTGEAVTMIAVSVDAD